MNQNVSRTAILLASWLTLIAQIPAPAPMTVNQVLSRMSANTAGLRTYQVPVQIDAQVHKVITLPVTMNGTRYFKAPDKAALKMQTVPTLAKSFQNVYSSLGTPSTWPMTYNISMVTPSVSTGAPTYELRGVYKKPSNVDHVLLDVNATTFDPIQARWFYKNGSTIVMNIEENVVGGKFHLPTRESLDLHFPEYSGSAVVQYGAYVINQDIPDSVFSHDD